MKTLKRNQRPFYYCLYQEKRDVVNENGNKTGEKIRLYADPVRMMANISPATGQSNTEQIGNLDNYDKVIVFEDVNAPIDENTVLFLDMEPEFTEGVTVAYTPSATLFGEPTVDVQTVRIPKYNYIVRRVAKSLNSVSVAVRKVEIS